MTLISNLTCSEMIQGRSLRKKQTPLRTRESFRERLISLGYVTKSISHAWCVSAVFWAYLRRYKSVYYFRKARSLIPYLLRMKIRRVWYTNRYRKKQRTFRIIWTMSNGKTYVISQASIISVWDSYERICLETLWVSTRFLYSKNAYRMNQTSCLWENGNVRKQDIH